MIGTVRFFRLTQAKQAVFYHRVDIALPKAFRVTVNERGYLITGKPTPPAQFQQDLFHLIGG
ncbi:MAG: hypothetical protein C0613_08055 [Desulfobulbaceae bacterium]|nr:MAG: hypothetical protein C0613_08055 [Desulfobulbaceae bacterium]